MYMLWDKICPGSGFALNQPSISDYYEEFECVYPLHSALFVCVPVLYARKNCVIHEAVIIMWKNIKIKGIWLIGTAFSEMDKMSLKVQKLQLNINN